MNFVQEQLINNVDLIQPKFIGQEPSFLYNVLSNMRAAIYKFLMNLKTENRANNFKHVEKSVPS